MGLQAWVVILLVVGLDVHRLGWPTEVPLLEVLPVGFSCLAARMALAVF